MIADVPVGVFLSGGIDSTLVTSAAARESSQRIKTFTIGYDVGSFDETAQARRVAQRLGTEHHEVILTEAEVGERAPAMLASLDQPLADQALISLHALSEFARPLVTVALGGEGADELFGGYPRYRWIERAGRLESALPAATRSLGGLVRHTGRWSGAQRLLERAAPAPLLERHLDWVTGGRRHRREDLYGPRLAGSRRRLHPHRPRRARRLRRGVLRWPPADATRPGRLSARRRPRQDRSRQHAGLARDPHCLPAARTGRVRRLDRLLAAPRRARQDAAACDASARHGHPP